MMNGTRLSKTKMKVFFLQLMKRRIVQKSPFSRTNRKYFQCAIHPGPLHTAYVPWLTPAFSRRPPTIVPEACTLFPSLGVPSGLLLAPASRHASCCTHNTSTVERWDSERLKNFWLLH